MTSAADLRKGWCPGALRPMRSGDGLLVRVRPRAGAFSLSALRAIAMIADRFGSGEIDLTNRGNLQIRGVSDATFESVLASLGEAGLLDSSPEAEAVRNVVVDPLSGLEPGRADVRYLARGLEKHLACEPQLWALPGKFGFSFSGVADPRVGVRTSDVMVAADGAEFSIYLDGSDEACRLQSGDQVIDGALRLARAFVEFARGNDDLRRMRDAVARHGAAAIFAKAALNVSNVGSSRNEYRGDIVGALAREGVVYAVGVGLTFGRIVAGQLDALCEAAPSAGADVVHTSPQRVLVFPIAGGLSADEFLHVAAATGLITQATDIRVDMDVCPGSPACRNASTNTRADAQRLAFALSGSLRGCSLHISGCEKGCARRSEASLTLVGREGRYDIIRNGSADSPRVIETVNAEDVSEAISRLITEAAA